MLEGYIFKLLEDEDLVSPHSFEDKTRYVPFMSLAYVNIFVWA